MFSSFRGEQRNQDGHGRLKARSNTVADASRTHESVYACSESWHIGAVFSVTIGSTRVNKLIVPFPPFAIRDPVRGSSPSCIMAVSKHTFGKVMHADLLGAKPGFVVPVQLDSSILHPAADTHFLSDEVKIALGIPLTHRPRMAIGARSCFSLMRTSTTHAHAATESSRGFLFCTCALAAIVCGCQCGCVGTVSGTRAGAC